MKKTFKKKRLGIMVMSLVMTTSMTISALAVPNPTPDAGNPEDFTSNTATTTVNMLGMTDAEIGANLSATVPITVKLAAMGDGTIKGPTNYAVTNTSKTKSIRVRNVKGSAANGFVLDGNPTHNRIDLSRITFRPDLGGTPGTEVRLQTIQGNGHNTTLSEWTLEPASGTNNSSVGVTFGGTINATNLPNNVTQAGGATAFYLVYTIELTPNTNP